jgi:hypothetical protein
MPAGSASGRQDIRIAMANKLVFILPKPMPASGDCLPHAAMTLGSTRGSGMRPAVGMVSRVVIQEQMGYWCMYRLDAAGGFVGDSWHPTREDALHTAAREFGLKETDAAVTAS